jgi:hypothetical protein
MKSIGFRCGPDDVAYVVLDGTLDSPRSLDHGNLRAPKFASRAEALAWLRTEVHALLDRHKPDLAFYKAAEVTARRPSSQRAEFEGVLQEAGISHRSRTSIERRFKQQVARQIGITGSAKYLTRRLRDFGLEELDTATYAEAAVTALCGLARG